MEHWEWIEANYWDEVFSWLFVTIESNIVVSLMVAPVKEVLSAYLFLEEENRFSPMSEYQALFFTMLTYPYIYLISLYLAPSQLVTIPLMLFWYFVDPEILV